jgi:hypothetical protein
MPKKSLSPPGRGQGEGVVQSGLSNGVKLDRPLTLTLSPVGRGNWS